MELLLPKTKPILVGTIYRPPKQNDFLEHFEELLLNIRTDQETYILGDFNICCLQKKSSANKSYFNVLRLFNFNQLIEEPTRVTTSSSSLIDHILCNTKEKVCQYGTIPVGLSDHFLTFCTRKTVRGSINKHKTTKIRSLKNYTKDDFLHRLKNANWESCFYATNVENAWSAFSDIFMSILNSIAPVKEVRLKQRTEPWVDSELLDLMRSRDRFLYQFKKHGNSEDYRLFCSYRNQVQRYIRKAKADYFSNKIEENKNNSKNLWQQLKSLGYKNKKDDNSNIVLTINEDTCHDHKTIADYFNQFFTTVASVLVQKLPACSKVYDYKSEAFRNFYKSKNPEGKKFVLKHVTEDFVFKELMHLNTCKSTGLDGIPARFLKDGADFLKLPITWIINSSISENTVPSEMKRYK